MNTDKKNRLEPSEYKKQLSLINLHKISLNSFSASVNRSKIGSLMETFIEDKRSYKVQEDGDVVFLHSFELLTTQKSKRNYAIKICCTYELIFRSSEKLTNDFWDIYSSINLHINTWPYFREFVQNTTQRMSIVPLTLPLMR